VRSLNRVHSAVSQGKRKAPAEESAEKYFKKLKLEVGAPSDFGKTHQQTAEDPLLLNHRPVEAQGIPTELLHRAFGHFRDNLSTLSVEPEDIQFTLDLRTAMSKYYRKEADRVKAFKKPFEQHYAIHLHGMSMTDSSTDASAIEGPFVPANVEAKNSVGLSGDPSLQNSAYYVKRITELGNRALQSPMPMLLISIAVCLIPNSNVGTNFLPKGLSFRNFGRNVS
jgi:hypothetical protein